MEHAHWDIAPRETRGFPRLSTLQRALQMAQKAASDAIEEAAGARESQLSGRLSRLEEELARLQIALDALVEGQRDTRDVVEEASMESFPASDPPGYQP